MGVRRQSRTAWMLGAGVILHFNEIISVIHLTCRCCGWWVYFYLVLKCVPSYQGLESTDMFSTRCGRPSIRQKTMGESLFLKKNKKIPYWVSMTAMDCYSPFIFFSHLFILYHGYRFSACLFSTAGFPRENKPKLKGMEQSHSHPSPSSSLPLCLPLCPCP